MLYHASKEKGIKVLKPHVSTHGKAYVYAIAGKVTAVCFGAPHSDFDLLMDEKGGIVHLYECYPDAFIDVYENKSCSLYELSEEGFETGKTGWEPELVCEKEVPVLNEVAIEDVYSFLKISEESGECVLHRFSEKPEYKELITSELEERITAWNLNKADILESHPKLRRIL